MCCDRHVTRTSGSELFDHLYIAFITVGLICTESAPLTLHNSHPQAKVYCRIDVAYAATPSTGQRTSDIGIRSLYLINQRECPVDCSPCHGVKVDRRISASPRAFNHGL